MSIKLTILNKAVEWLVGGDLLNFVKEAVATINNEDLSGDAKRSAVFNAAKELFSDFASVFINLAIEVAVLLLKAQIEKEA